MCRVTESVSDYHWLAYFLLRCDILCIDLPVKIKKSRRVKANVCSWRWYLKSQFKADVQWKPTGARTSHNNFRDRGIHASNASSNRCPSSSSSSSCVTSVCPVCCPLVDATCSNLQVLFSCHLCFTIKLKALKPLDIGCVVQNIHVQMTSEGRLRVYYIIDTNPDDKYMKMVKEIENIYRGNSLSFQNTSSEWIMHLKAPLTRCICCQ